MLLQRMPAADVGGFAISANGTLAVLSEDRTVQLWDLTTRALVRSLRLQNGFIARWETMAFLPKGDALRVATPQGSDLLDLAGHEQPEPPYRLQYPPGLDTSKIEGLELSSLGAIAASTMPWLKDSVKVVLWPSVKGPPRVFEHEGFTEGQRFARTSGALWYAVGRKLGKGLDDEVETQLFRVAPTGRDAPERVWTQRGVFDLRAVSNDERWIAISDQVKGTMVLVDPRTGKIRWTRALPYEAAAKGGPAQAVFGFTEFTTDGATLVSLTRNGIAEIDAATGRLEATFGQRLRPRDQVVVASPRLSIAVDSRGGALSYWQLPEGVVTRTTAVRGLSGVWPSGDREAIIGYSGDAARRCGDKKFVKWLRRESATPPREDALPAPSDPVGTIATWPPPLEQAIPLCLDADRMIGDLDVPHGRVLLHSYDSKKPLVVQDLRTGSQVALEDSASFMVLPSIGYGLTPEGSLVVGVLNDGQPSSPVRVWDAATGKVVTADLRTTMTAVTKLQGAAIGPDGRAFAQLHDGVVDVLSLPDGKALAHIAPSPTEPASLAFGATDDVVLLGAKTGALEVWQGGRKVAIGASDGGLIVHLRAGPKGTVMSMSDDQALRVWDVHNAVPRAGMVDFADGEYLAFTPGGAYGGTEEVADRIGWLFEKPTELFRFEQFASSFHRPELVSARLDGEGNDITAAAGRPPRLTLSGAPPVRVTTGHVPLRVSYASDVRVDVVRAYDEGRLVAEQAVCAPSGDVDLDVPLLSGNNRIVVTAFDARGFASNGLSMDVDDASAGAAQPQLWVVAAGVSHYPHLWPSAQLAAADADARAVVAAMTAQTGPGKPYATSPHVVELENEQVTSDSLTKALEGLEQMRRDDVAVVFLAGHGLKPAPNEDMVFVTGAVNRKADVEQVDLESVRRTAIGWSSVAASLARAKGRVLVLLDACHAGHVTEEIVGPNDALASSLSREDRAGVVVFAATKGRQYSYEGETARALQLEATAQAAVGASTDHGFFTAAFVKALSSRETDRNGDGQIQLSELLDEVTHRVTIASGARQTPWVARREMIGDFRIAAVAR